MVGNGWRGTRHTRSHADNGYWLNKDAIASVAHNDSECLSRTPRLEGPQGILQPELARTSGCILIPPPFPPRLSWLDPRHRLFNLGVVDGLLKNLMDKMDSNHVAQVIKYDRPRLPPPP